MGDDEVHICENIQINYDNILSSRNNAILNNQYHCDYQRCLVCGTVRDRGDGGEGGKQSTLLS